MTNQKARLAVPMSNGMGMGNEEASEEQGLKRESAGRALLRKK